jgi:hypothetical protein
MNLGLFEGARRTNASFSVLTLPQGAADRSVGPAGGGRTRDTPRHGALEIMGNLPSWLVDPDAFQESENETFGQIAYVTGYAAAFGFALSAFFTWRRWQSPSHFSVKKGARPPDLPPPQEGIFAWARSLIALDESTFLKFAGLDALIFLRMYILAAKVMVLFLPYALIVVLPVNWSGEYYTQSYSGINNYTRMSMSNMEPGSSAMWAHVGGVILLTLIAFYLMDGEFNTYTRLRHMYLQKPAPHLRTVMLDDVPEDMRSPSLLYIFFHMIYPQQVARVTISLNTRELSQVLKERDSVVAELERIEARDQEGHETRRCPKRLFYSFRDEDRAMLAARLEDLNATVGRLQAQSRETTWEEGDETGDPEVDAMCRGDIPMPTGSPAIHQEIKVGGRKGSLIMQMRMFNESLTGSQAALSSPSSNEVALLSSESVEISADAQRWAFITFKTFGAATVAQQVNHSTGDGRGQLRPFAAPEPRDLCWEHSHISRVERRARRLWADAFLFGLSVFWVIPVTLTYIVFSPDALNNTFPRIGELSAKFVVVQSFVELIYPSVLMLVMSLLPPIIRMVGVLEGSLCESEIQSTGLGRYYIFQVLNVFLVTTLAGTVFDTLYLIVDDPKSTFTLLGESLPKVAGFFTEYILIKMLSGLLLELSRLTSSFLDALRKFISPQETARDRASERLGMRPYRTAGWFNYLKITAQDLLVVLLALTYANVNPFIVIVSLGYFVMAYVVYKHQLLYVYDPSFESGGALFPKIFRRFVFSVVIAQATMIGVLVLKEGYYQAGVVAALLIITLLLKKSMRRRYEPISSCLPMELARRLDVDEEQLSGTMDRMAYVQPDLKSPAFVQPEKEDGSALGGKHMHEEKPYVALR